MFGDGPLRSEIQLRENGVRRVLLHLPHGIDEAAVLDAQRQLIDMLFAEQRIGSHVLWYYTPMALPFTRHLKPLAVVYDCMDELSAFARRARRRCAQREARAAGARRPRVHRRPEPLRGQARTCIRRSTRSRAASTSRTSRARGSRSAIPPTRPRIPHPRLGFFGVIDERIDLDLLRGVAGAAARLAVRDARAGREDRSARRCRSGPNIHYLGIEAATRSCRRYLAGWDVALLPFARNESTRFISPTKTPEYLAAGRPWCRRRSATWCARTASRGWRASPTRRPSSSPRSTRALREDAARGRSAPTRSCARCRGTSPGPACASWWTASSASSSRPPEHRCRWRRSRPAAGGLAGRHVSAARSQRAALPAASLIGPAPAARSTLGVRCSTT